MDWYKQTLEIISSKMNDFGFKGGGKVRQGVTQGKSI